MTAQEVQALIEAGLPGATVDVSDQRGTGDHFAAVVRWEGFRDLSLVDQHKLVYATLGDRLTREIHALQLQTGVPE